MSQTERRLTLPAPPVPGSTLVLQSHQHVEVNCWIPACIESVKSWSSNRGYAYCFVDDELFNLLPPEYCDRFAGRGPVLSDLARLLALQQALDTGWAQAVWADADLLIYSPGELQPAKPHDCAFGRETWVEDDRNGRLRAWRSVHNAFMQFSAGSVVLPYLIMSIRSMALRIDPGKIAPQVFGPKLLTALHSISQFNLIEQVTAFSPVVLTDIARGQGRYLRYLHQVQPQVPAAANLCASLASDDHLMMTVIERLLTNGLPDGS